MEDIAQTVIEHKTKQIKTYPVNANHASQAGHPCERYLVLLRTHWQERTLPDVGLQFVFDGGNMIERMALRELEDAGFELVEQQRAFSWPELELTGRLDMKLRLDGALIPVEVKGLNHWDFEKLNTMEDFLRSPKPWIRKYPAQLILYMLMAGDSEEGIFYLKDKLNYRPKAITIKLDYDYGEMICRKLERVNKHVKDGTGPDQIDDPDVCARCDFLHICLPEIRRSALETVDDPDLEAKLERYEELKPLKAEYETLDREFKKLFKGRERLMIGNYLITGKEVIRKGYKVPDSTYWQKKIMHLVNPQEEVKDV